jgi:hypothetical protein
MHSASGQSWLETFSWTRNIKVSGIRTHMTCFSWEISIRKGKKKRRKVCTNKINVTTWDRRRREEIDWFEGDATFSDGLRAFLRPYLILGLLDSIR